MIHVLLGDAQLLVKKYQEAAVEYQTGLVAQAQEAR